MTVVRTKKGKRLYVKDTQTGSDVSTLGDMLRECMLIDTLEDAGRAVAAWEDLGWRRPPWGRLRTSALSEVS